MYDNTPRKSYRRRRHTASARPLVSRRDHSSRASGALAPIKIAGPETLGEPEVAHRLSVTSGPYQHLDQLIAPGVEVVAQAVPLDSSGRVPK